MEKIKKEKVIIILILIVIISSIVTYFIYTSFKPYEIKTTDMYLTVGNYTGFDVNTSALVFGTVKPSSYVKRKINITNTDQIPRTILIRKKGELAEWTSISEKEFILEGNESKEIDIKIDVPYDAEHGKYTGSLKVIFR
jgi:uncharacterized protein YpmB